MNYKAAVDSSDYLRWWTSAMQHLSWLCVFKRTVYGQFAANSHYLHTNTPDHIVPRRFAQLESCECYHTLTYHWLGTSKATEALLEGSGPSCRKIKLQRRRCFLSSGLTKQLEISLEPRSRKASWGHHAHSNCVNTCSTKKRLNAIFTPSLNQKLLQRVYDEEVEERIDDAQWFPSLREELRWSVSRKTLQLTNPVTVIVAAHITSLSKSLSKLFYIEFLIKQHYAVSKSQAY